MYKIIATISIFVRGFILPNPFESLGDSVSISIGSGSFPIPPFLINIIAEPILHVVTYLLVGLYYTRGVDDPSKGSLLYIILYGVHVGLLYIMGLLGFSTWAVAIVLLLYIAAHIGINILRERRHYGY